MVESFPNAAIDIGGTGRSANRMGKLKYQRFRVKAEENISCVAVRQYTRLRVADPGFLLSSIEDTRILGWYRAAPRTKLTDETMESFLQGVGVKGLPKRAKRKKRAAASSALR